MDAESVDSAPALSEHATVGVIGAGAMGAGIAQVAVLAGHPVSLYDTRAGAAQTACAKVLAMVEQLVAKGRATEAQAEGARGKLKAAAALAELAECDLVIEAIVEDLTAKRSLFVEVEGLVRPSTLLATNTSSISITAIGSALQAPGRLVGMHFFNPAPLMPLVEVISGVQTSVEAAQCLYATAKCWGKVPVYAKSTPGFIVNRVARPFYAEALRVLQEGGSDCATMDAILREAGGFRMGPFELMDLIGHDVNYAVTRSVFDAFYADRRFTPSILQLQLVEAGQLGRKTRQGFYDYREGAPAISPSTHPAGPAPEQIILYEGSHCAAALAERLATKQIVFTTAKAHSDARVAESSGCTLYVCDGRTATARAHTSGVQNAVLIDLALSFGSAKRLAIAAADQSGQAATNDAAALLTSAGYAVSVIDDLPGMVVLRTLAMLANEAADTVHQGVCSAQDCDLAMRNGANYPQGPLEWADSFGIERVIEALEHLEVAYGDGRYRISPLLRRKAVTSSSFTERKESAHA